MFAEKKEMRKHENLSYSGYDSPIREPRNLVPRSRQQRLYNVYR